MKLSGFILKNVIFLMAACLPLSLYAKEKTSSSLPLAGQALIDSLLKELPGQKEDSNKVKLLNTLSQKHLGTDVAQSLGYAQSALLLAEKLTYKYGIANSRYLIGVVYSIQGNSPEALKNQSEALKLFKELKNKLWISKCYFSIGTIYLRIDNFSEALKNYFSALKLKEEIGDKKGQASCYINIGNVYNVQKKHTDALQNYNAALQVSREIGDKEQVGISLQNIANIYSLEENAEEALKNDSAALKIFEEIDNKYGIASCYKGIGNVYAFRKNLPEANKAFTMAEKIFAQQKDNLSLADIYGGKGTAYFNQGQFSNAEKYFNKALELGKIIGSLSIVKAANESLSETYAQLGDYKKSLETYKASILIKDSMFNEENTKKTLQAQMQYDFDKKESLAKIEQANKDAAQKIQMQRKNILIYGTFSAFAVLLFLAALLIRQGKLKANQERIELEQKQLRAQMNPHFIFNCLNSIQHFVVANDIKNANKYLSGFALIMRQTLENSKQSNIVLRKEITYLKNYLSLEMMLFEDKFNYEISCAQDIDTDTMEIPTMIIQPFVENAIRHGLAYLKEKIGMLSIKFYKKDNQLFCEIDDNGIGREQSQKLKIVSEIVYESQGMELTRQRLALVSKSNGSDYEITITDKKNSLDEPEGTTITIKFPLDA